jgi:hypothetical protein
MKSIKMKILQFFIAISILFLSNIYAQDKKFRLKDSLLIDKIEKAVIPQCLDNERLRNSAVYSIMPDRSDFEYFVICDFICRGYYGSAGHDGSIGRIKNGKVELLCDAGGRDLISISDDLTNGFRRVKISLTESQYEIYYDGKKFQHMNFGSQNIPEALSNCLYKSFPDEGKNLFLTKWAWQYQKKFQIGNKTIYSIGGFYDYSASCQLIECQDFFTKCKAITLPISIDSIYLSEKPDGSYPVIKVFKKSIFEGTLTHKKGRYYSSDCDIYGRSYNYYPNNFELDALVKNKSKTDFSYRNGIVQQYYHRKINRFITEKGIIYWNGTRYKRTSKYKITFFEKKS